MGLKEAAGDCRRVKGVLLAAETEGFRTSWEVRRPQKQLGGLQRQLGGLSWGGRRAEKIMKSTSHSVRHPVVPSFRDVGYFIPLSL